MSTVGIVIICIIFAAVFACMVVAAVFVYRDAKKRNMNPILWAIVAFVVPFFVGAIAYFVIREPIVSAECPNCGNALQNDAKACEKCGTVMMAMCEKCDFPIQKKWKSCPNCGNELPEKFNQPIFKYKKESGIIPVGIIICVLVFAFALLDVVVRVFDKKSVETYSSGYGNCSGMYNITEEDLSVNVKIKEWIEKSKKEEDDVFVLISKKSSTCIVYVKDNNALLEDSMAVKYYSENKEMKKFEMSLNLSETKYEDKYGYDFFVYKLDVYDEVEFDVFIDDEKQDISVTYTDSDISVATWEVK